MIFVYFDRVVEDCAEQCSGKLNFRSIVLPVDPVDTFLAVTVQSGHVYHDFKPTRPKSELCYTHRRPKWSDFVDYSSVVASSVSRLSYTCGRCCLWIVSVHHIGPLLPNVGEIPHGTSCHVHLA